MAEATNKKLREARFFYDKLAAQEQQIVRNAYSTDRERGFHAIVNTAVGWAAGHRCFT
jgi:hypothetical protein